MEQQQFDALEYFAGLGKKNKLAKKNNFYIGFCSGQGSLVPIMNEYRDYENFILVDDTTSGSTFGNGASFFDRNVYCIHILAGYDYGDEDSYKNAMELCRKLFRQFLSRVVKDKETYKFKDKLNYLNTKNVYSNEYGRYSFNGCTGLFFQIQNDEPVDLVFDEDEWEE